MKKISDTIRIVGHVFGLMLGDQFSRPVDLAARQYRYIRFEV